MSMRNRGRVSMKRRTVWTFHEGFVTIPGAETRVLFTALDVAAAVGIPSPTLVCTRGVVQVYNVDDSLVSRSILALLFINEPLASGSDQAPSYNIFANGSRSYPVFEPFLNDHVAASANAVPASTSWQVRSEAGSRIIDSKSMHRVDGNDSHFAWLFSNNAA